MNDEMKIVLIQVELDLRYSRSVEERDNNNLTNKNNDDVEGTVTGRRLR